MSGFMSRKPLGTPEPTQLIAQAYMSHDDVTCYDTLTCGAAHVGKVTSNRPFSLISLFMSKFGTALTKMIYQN